MVGDIREKLVSSRNTSTILLKTVVEPLLASKNPNDRRKGRDLRRLVALQQGAWAGRVAVLGARPGERRTLEILVQIRAAGLVWDGSPQPSDTFQVMLGIPNNYPLSPPMVILRPTPFHPNVLDRHHLPNTHGLPAELQQLVNDGHDGACCYVMASEWTPDLDHDLVLVVRQIARMLGGRMRGEKYALNIPARDYYLKLQAEARLPLGPALPLSVDEEPGTNDPVSEEVADDAIEWVDEPSM
jgi:hypothetical protein